VCPNCTIFNLQSAGIPLLQLGEEGETEELKISLSGSGLVLSAELLTTGTRTLLETKSIGTMNLLDTIPTQYRKFTLVEMRSLRLGFGLSANHVRETRKVTGLLIP